MTSQLSLFESPPKAVFSACTLHTECDQACTGRLYRYLLEWSTGVPSARIVCWVLANPSTASAEQTDPTVRRCLGYSRAWGYGRILVVNVRAWRGTDPTTVPPDPEAIGQETDRYLLAAAQEAELVVCGWGALGGARGESVLAALRAAGVTPYALGTTASGAPRHPLYLAADLLPAALPLVTQPI